MAEFYTRIGPLALSINEAPPRYWNVRKIWHALDEGLIIKIGEKFATISKQLVSASVVSSHISNSSVHITNLRRSNG